MTLTLPKDPLFLATLTAGLPINDTPAGACPHHRADTDAKDETDELWG